TERLVAELMQQYPDLSLTKVIVSEAGASVYSASELAANEFPDLDVSIRGAVSIARRLQDPLAELVKIDPKAIGVGQYQHDVNQTRLARSLEAVVEDCVNAVGVDVNRASVALLMRVSGFNETLAKNLVQHRETHGAFSSREILRSVPRMGDKAFQQAAGFLRIIGGENPLDQSAVHPEAYPLVERVLSEKQWTLPMVLGDVDKIRSLEPQHFVDTHYGLSTVKDVLTELEKPGRDPRPVFRTACFQEGIKEITDLKVGMLLEGVVSNVTNFGIFVDVGVHQDGLVHISEMAERFVKDPHAVAKAGEVVQVKVMEVNLERRRIGLSMRLQERAPVVSAPRGPKEKSTVAPSRDKPVKTSAFKKKPAEPVAKKPQLFNTMMADALSRCLKDA
ncbi:MAG: helix-hairpin-helix domain-containing protein, partial [Legionellaceae bacterium]|nr:helix-hairpin-helix domain-containing protein [Legionellaceae bacterium]